GGGLARPSIVEAANSFRELIRGRQRAQRGKNCRWRASSEAVDHQGFIAVADAERRAAISAPFPVTFHGAMTEVCRAFPPAAKKFCYSPSVNLHGCPPFFWG